MAIWGRYISHPWLSIASTCGIRSTSSITVSSPTNSRYVDHIVREVTELNLQGQQR
jgi:hypothetical protein